jgi:hypothetical protein
MAYGQNLTLMGVPQELFGKGGLDNTKDLSYTNNRPNEMVLKRRRKSW